MINPPSDELRMRIHVHVRYAVLVACGAFGLASLALYLRMAANPTVETSIAIAGAWTACAAILYSAKSLHVIAAYHVAKEARFKIDEQSRADRHAELMECARGIHDAVARAQETQTELRTNREKQRVALEIISRFYEPGFSGVVRECSKIGQEIRGTEAKEVAVSLRENESWHPALLSVFNFFECMAVAIEQEAADEAILYDFFNDVALWYYHSFSGYIAHKRQNAGSRDGMRHFEMLTRRWSERKGSPFSQKSAEAGKN